MCSVKDYPPPLFWFYICTLFYGKWMFGRPEREPEGLNSVPCEHQGLSLIPRTVVEQPGLPCVLGIPGLRKQRLADSQNQ